MANPTPSVLVAGAGIGGLTLGIALRQAGLDVQIFEQAEALRPVGWGLAIQMNALAALRELGLHERVIAGGVRIPTAFIQTWQGKRLLDFPVAEAERCLGLPMIAIHRGQLQTILQDAFGAEGLHLGSPVAGFEQTEPEATLLLKDGGRVSGALLIGADGVHSALRAQLRGHEQPRYAGYTVWRGLAPMRLREAVFCESWGCGLRFGYGQIAPDEVYWFAIANAPAGTAAEGYDREALARRFKGWHDPIEELIATTPDAAVLRTDIYDRPPMRPWGSGRVTLLGDAAHPMTPNLGQGACQACEDAVVLADALKRHGLEGKALRDYESRRYTRTARIVEDSRRLGAIGQLDNPLVCALRDMSLRWTPSALLLHQFMQTATFSPR